MMNADGAHLHIAAVTIGQIQAGIEITRAQDADKATELEHWLDQATDLYNVLSMYASASTCWAQLLHKKSDTLYEDAMIAAIAKAHGLTVVTRNVKGFSGIAVAVFNPFTG